VRFFANIRGIDAIRSILTVDRSDFDDGERGVSVGVSSFATVTRSTFNNHGEAGVYTDGSLGVIVGRSTFDGGSSTGIRCGDACTITDNVIRRNGNGVSTFDARLVLIGNDIVENIVGYEPGSRTGSPEDVRGNRFLDNQAAVRALGGAFGFGGGAKSELRRNLFDGNGVGFWAAAEGDYSILLDRNTFTNGRDGVFAPVGSPAWPATRP